jgi:imidazolonepropionase-like amidohydrolase
MYRALTVLAAVAAVASVASQGRQTTGLALVGGTVYPSPGEEPIRDSVVLIRDGRIAAVGDRRSIQIPGGVASIDCAGRTVTAGFWNSHVHFFERKWTNAAAIPAPELEHQLQEMLTRYGFTSAFDLGSAWANTRQIRDRVEAGEVRGPRIRSTGEVLVARGAVPPDSVIRALGYMTVRNLEIADASQAIEATVKQLGAGVDGIKVHLQPPPAPSPPIPSGAIEAAVAAAHRAGKPVFVHPNSPADVLAAARAGVDVIAHTTPASGPWDDTILSTMKERRVALIPTLMAWKTLLRHERVSIQASSVANAIAQLRAWTATGGTTLFGTDLGAADYDPADEYTLMAQAGMTVRQILAALTTAPAERFGMSRHLGKVEAGFAADLTVLNGDPSSDVRALAAVQYTIRDGRIIYGSN